MYKRQALKAVEGGNIEHVSAVFSVRSVPVTKVSYDSPLVVPIRSSAFKHPYTVLPVTVAPANASRPALEFKRNEGNNTAPPIQVSVTGPQGEGLYLFEPKNKNNYTDREEELVGVVKDDKSKKDAASSKSSSSSSGSSSSSSHSSSGSSSSSGSASHSQPQQPAAKRTRTVYITRAGRYYSTGQIAAARQAWLSQGNT